MSLERRLVALTLLLAAGCRDKPADADPAPSASAEAGPTPPVAELQRPTPAYELLDNLRTCELHHQGIVIDLGDTASESRRAFALGPFTDVKRGERKGERWLQLFTRQLDLQWWLSEPTDSLSISVRARGVMIRRRL
jgi:hypothetical protein